MGKVDVGIDFKEFQEFAKFCDSWGQHLSKAEFINIMDSQRVVDSVAEFIGDEIMLAVENDAFGRFMADRTYVEVVPTARGVTFRIGGYSEQEMKEMGRDHRLSDEAFEDMIDYNLWEMYEFHGGAIGTKGIPVGVNEKQAVKKDVAGPLVIRTKTGGTQQLKGRQGLIRGVLGQIANELRLKLLDLLGDATDLVVAEAAVEAANEAKALKGLSSAMNKQMKRAANEYGVDLAKMGASGQHVIPAKNERILVQGGMGRFVKPPLHGKKYKIKK